MVIERRWPPHSRLLVSNRPMPQRIRRPPSLTTRTGPGELPSREGRERETEQRRTGRMSHRRGAVSASPRRSAVVLRDADAHEHVLGRCQPVAQGGASFLSGLDEPREPVVVVGSRIVEKPHELLDLLQ